MSARVLVVDDIEANRRLLQAKLSHEYYQVLTATNGQEAVDLAKSELPDIILLDVMMPGMDGFEACRILKAEPTTEHIPIVMLTALGDRADRLNGLRNGADDFLTKPVDDFSLMSRIRALTKYKNVVDELRQRNESGRRIGVIEAGEEKGRTEGARIFIIDDNPRQARRLSATLSDSHNPMTIQESGGLGEASKTGVDLLVISLSATTFDPLRLCAHFRSSASTKDLPMLVIADVDDEQKAVRALDLGASDVIVRPVDDEELEARVRTQLRKKLYVDMMRKRLDQSMAMAVTDQLTGLHNRRYMTTQLDQHLKRANTGHDHVSVLVADVDRFKSVNDSYGHDVGDEVLQEFSKRLTENVRPGDIACRFGGEEFVVVMPGTRGDMACQVAERVRREVAAMPFRVQGLNKPLDITVSLGVSTSVPPDDTQDALLKRADEALYRAKQSGRNRVEAEAA